MQCAGSAKRITLVFGGLGTIYRFLRRWLCLVPPVCVQSYGQVGRDAVLCAELCRQLRQGRAMHLPVGRVARPQNPSDWQSCSGDIGRDVVRKQGEIGQVIAALSSEHMRPQRSRGLAVKDRCSTPQRSLCRRARKALRLSRRSAPRQPRRHCESLTSTFKKH